MKALILTPLLWISMSATTYAENYETAAYEVIKADESQNLEVRSYLPHVVAETAMASFDDGNKGFMPLFRYISGANKAATADGSTEIAMTTPVTVSSQKIDMTTPVTVAAQNGAKPGEATGSWKMAFVLPRQYTSAASAPQPTNPAISLRDVPAFKAISLRFSWWSSKSDLEKHSKTIQTYAAETGYTLKGQPYMAYYDSPFTLPWRRRNEVLWQVE